MMNKYLAISKISKIRYEVSEYIACELRKRGIEGLVVSHGNILDILYENNGKLTMKEISEGIDRSKSTVTKLVDRLLKAGYVTKESNSEDKRYSYIVLTEKGLSIKKDFKEISQNVIKEFFKDFNEEETKILLLLLDRVIHNFTQ
ncbi:MarR family winged helix-turn-helix transcriptional regulator [Clostridium sp. DJ247]|uniref:MarR family winged helix-turn-helix transcriptional regulator n=1 Tax=Clostridium sp. DJ247 TaxID=2726188 RepID=UPI001627ECB7|nr:MarR family transcriptional regulator [Clostridium sp. DJ247]MBC2579069.1 MarR family transcriptional regulator [Clostridium sp. DJ247]